MTKGSTKHGLNELPGKRDTERLWKQITEALEMLEAEKLIKKVVVVTVWDSEREKCQCSYDLHVKGERLKGSLRDRVRAIAADNLDKLETRADGRCHDGNYYAIAPAGKIVELSMVYRLTHVALVGDAKHVRTTQKCHSNMVLEWLSQHEVMDGNNS